MRDLVDPGTVIPGDLTSRLTLSMRWPDLQPLKLSDHHANLGISQAQYLLFVMDVRCAWLGQDCTNMETCRLCVSRLMHEPLPSRPTLHLTSPSSPVPALSVVISFFFLSLKRYSLLLSLLLFRYFIIRSKSSCWTAVLRTLHQLLFYSAHLSCSLTRLRTRTCRR